MLKIMLKVLGVIVVLLVCWAVIAMAPYLIGIAIIYYAAVLSYKSIKKENDDFSNVK